MAPFKKFSCQEMQIAEKNHPFQAITAFHVGEIFGKSYLCVVNMQTAVQYNSIQPTGF
jgi:hypothetical protein